MRIIFVTTPLYWKAHIKHGGHVCICKNDSFVGQFESLFAPVMATFGWSYKSNASGSKRPREQLRKVEEWQKNRNDSTVKPLHPQSHSAETLTAGSNLRKKKCEYYDFRKKLVILRHDVLCIT